MPRVFFQGLIIPSQYSFKERKQTPQLPLNTTSFRDVYIFDEFQSLKLEIQNVIKSYWFC